MCKIIFSCILILSFFLGMRRENEILLRIIKEIVLETRKKCFFVKFEKRTPLQIRSDLFVEIQIFYFGSDC